MLDNNHANPNAIASIVTAPIAVAPIMDLLKQKCDVSVFGEIASTNEQSLQWFREGRCSPFACFAETQTQGRGRRGRAWLSPPGGNIYMSLAWRFEVPLHQLARLSLIMAIAVARTLESIGLAGVGIKWPNDVLVDGKKIAGILIETASFSTQHTEAVIGVGINYVLPEAINKMLPQPVTDICAQLGRSPEGGRNRVAGELLNECISLCQSYVHDQERLMQSYKKHYDICTGKKASILLDDGEQLEGLVLGVASNGELRVKINGEERVFNSAEISLRT